MFAVSSMRLPASDNIPVPSRRVAIMQPYFFPYIGYFQLMACCDTFVLHDDVQYIKEGWVNRNRILVNGRAEWLTLPVEYASHSLPISQRHYVAGEGWRKKLLRRLEGAYRHAPNYSSTMALLDRSLSNEECNVAAFNANALREIANAVGARVVILESSSLEKDNSTHGAERVAAICSALGATTYINPVGGAHLYSESFFNQRGLNLEFLRPRLEVYAQGNTPFVPSLSIIDVLMFNDFSSVARMMMVGGRAALQEDRPGDR
jgi:hypothetical protein